MDGVLPESALKIVAIDPAANNNPQTKKPKKKGEKASKASSLPSSSKRERKSGAILLDKETQSIDRELDIRSSRRHASREARNVKTEAE